MGKMKNWKSLPLIILSTFSIFLLGSCNSADRSYPERIPSTKEGDIELLEYLADILREGALCALGTTAANPVLSTIKYFRDEYKAHIYEKKCPARVCRDLIQYYIIAEKCPGCGLCIKACPQEAITPMGKKQPVVLDESKCIKCGACYDVCKLGAIGKR